MKRKKAGFKIGKITIVFVLAVAAYLYFRHRASVPVSGSQAGLSLPIGTSIQTASQGPSSNVSSYFQYQDTNSLTHTVPVNPGHQQIVYYPELNPPEILQQAGTTNTVKDIPYHWARA